MGPIFLLPLLGWGIYKCFVLAKRPTSNAKCAYSLGIMLEALALFAIPFSLFTTTDPAGQIVVLASARVLLFLAILVCSLLASLSVVFAILGLWEIQQNKTADHFAPTSGRGIAIFALVLLSLVFCVPAAAGFASAPRRDSSPNPTAMPSSPAPAHPADEPSALSASPPLGRALAVDLSGNTGLPRRSHHDPR